MRTSFSQRKSFWKGWSDMTNAELILKLVEMLIESEKKQKAKANEQKGQSKD